MCIFYYNKKYCIILTILQRRLSLNIKVPVVSIINFLKLARRVKMDKVQFPNKWKY